MPRAPLSQLDDWGLVNEDQDLRGKALLDANGTPLGTIREMIVDTNSEYVEAVALDDGREFPASALDLRADGIYLQQAMRTPEPVAEPARQVADQVAIPVVAEQLRIGKRAVDRGGVRVNVSVEEVPVEEQVTLREETVEVERRQVGRTLSSDEAAQLFQEGTLEVREHHEEAVAQKQARVVEEVVISKDVEERTETVRDTVRHTDVDVQQLGDKDQRR